MFFKKLTLSILSALILTLSFVPYVHAQETWYNQSWMNFYTKVYGTQTPASEIFGERYTAAQVEWVIYSLMSILLNKVAGNNIAGIVCIFSVAGGVVPIDSCLEATINVIDRMYQIVDPIRVLFTADASSTSTYANLGVVGSYLAVVSDSPISGVGYIKNTLAKFRIIPEAKAQGFGFNTGASMMIGIWRAARDVTYGLLVLAIIIMSFMIMFRVKISPQAVISVQSALPKIAIAMILITFSYAIAGFLIDIMYLVIGLLSLIISSSGISTLSPTELFRAFTQTYSALGILLLYMVWFSVISLAVVANSFVSSLTAFLSSLVLLIVGVFTILVVIYISIKVMIMFIKTFANIMIGIITGPFEILLGTVVNGMGFGSWVKRMLSYLMVYPITALLFLLAFFFLINSVPDSWIVQFASRWIPFGVRSGQLGNSSWAPPFSGGGPADVRILWAFMSLVIITLIPKTIEIIQGFITGRPFAYGTAIGEAVSQPVGGTIRTVSTIGDIGRAWATRFGTRTP